MSQIANIQTGEALVVADEEIINDLQNLVHEMEQVLRTVVQECEYHRFGRPGYDMTMDHLWEEANGMLEHLYREKAWGYYV